ncbi:PT domain-containing protein [Thermoleptolyngbya sp. C42_A2020_037]|uniref:PT domain-containing protein n=1 Tax=Thermoleptolyngbya sp. C42_A2020_037 TaxID=2747799 RepID=UPI0019F6002F|nr:PT domain-containing protein [Thermoleptolyngbya sp. C42_A2020_037]MBF2085248.1 PT domain-containing protein [Thermoleptolyngbya sp. C42_A2020_037]
MPASGRFQSRLLSYLSRQRLRLGDRTSRWLRQAANAAALGAQVVLYPVYVAFQSMRLAGRQMGPAAQRVGLFLENVKRSVQGKPALPASPPPVDAPIHKTLRAIRSAGFATKQIAAPESPDSRAIALRSPADLIPFDPTEDDRVSLALCEASALAALDAAQLRSPSAQALAGNFSTEIGGIASRLDSRLLVLVTTTNALIDLSPQQQRWLQQQIIWELADYGRARRRWLRRAGLAGRRSAGELGSGATDGAIADLAAPLPHSLASSQRGRLARMLPVPMPRESAALPVQAFYQLMAWVQTGPVAIAANLFQEAALAVYFPPPEPDPQPAASFPSTAYLPHSAPAHSRAAASLSPASLPNLRPRSPGEILLQLLAEQPAEQLAGQPTGQPTGQPAEQLTDFPTEFISAERLASTRAIAPSICTTDLIPDAHSVILTISRQDPSLLTPQPSNPSTLPSPNSSHPPSAAQPPYIDTPATLVRYEKHPLEAVLDWIDRSIVWLETRLADLWRWLRGESDGNG